MELTHTSTTGLSIANKVRLPGSPDSRRLLKISADTWDAIEKLTAELKRVATLSIALPSHARNAVAA